jgi:hypothetical protein
MVGFQCKDAISKHLHPALLVFKNLYAIICIPVAPLKGEPESESGPNLLQTITRQQNDYRAKNERKMTTIIIISRINIVPSPSSHLNMSIRTKICFSPKSGRKNDG